MAWLSGVLSLILIEIPYAGRRVLMGFGEYAIKLSDGSIREHRWFLIPM